MSTDESKAVVRRMIEQGMVAGDLDGAGAAYAPDFVYHNPVLREMPDLPRGPAGVRQLLAATWAAFPDLTYTVERLIGEGDQVAVLYTWRGTHRGALGPIAPTGRTVAATGAIVCRVAEGRIVEQWDIDDRLDVMRQLGLLAMPGQPEP
jgi:steroid delta-isomerase-like uncharacterized protein